MNQAYQGQAVALLPGRLRGYRQWGLVDLTGGGDFVLQSITAKTRWPWTPTVEARCHLGQAFGRDADRRHPDDEVPKRDCSCGIYAKHRPDVLRGNGYPVGGVIEAWGPHTEIGTEGFRARYARLTALYVKTVQEQPSESDVLPPGWHPWVPPSERIRQPGRPDPTDEIREFLGQRYQVPTFGNLTDMIEALPPIDITDLLPKPEPTPDTVEWINNLGSLNGWPIKRSPLTPSPQLIRLLKEFDAAEILTGGCWFAAKPGTPPPLAVKDGRFEPWPIEPWQPLAGDGHVGCVGMGLDLGLFRRTVLLPENSGPFLHLLAPATASTSPINFTRMMLGWESPDRGTRYIFHQVVLGSHRTWDAIHAETVQTRPGRYAEFEAHTIATVTPFAQGGMIGPLNAPRC